jgi:AraC family transcriptional regulator of adaptative response / DNA-3-methyladenine glycosylase II
VSAARGLAAKLVALCGEQFARATEERLTSVFPTPARLAAANLATLGMPRARLAALRALAEAAAADPLLFDGDGDLTTRIARLRMLPGIGEWTAQYIALRALREPDAFPAADIGLLRALTGADGVRPTPAALLARAERWRPWRAYAAQVLWGAGRAPVGAVRRPSSCASSGLPILRPSARATDASLEVTA